MPQTPIHPTDLAMLMGREILRPRYPVAVDTETSGLWVDAGARISTISMAWRLDDEQVAPWARELGGGEQHLWDTGIWTLRKEVTAGARSNTWLKAGWVQEHWILSFAWPFDQGTIGTGKAEDPTEGIIENGRAGLLGALDWTPDLPEPHPNLGGIEWTSCLTLIGLFGQWVSLTMHNAKFDTHMLAAGVRWKPQDVIDVIDLVSWCTQTAASLWLSWRTADFGKPTLKLKPLGQWLWGEAEGDEKQVISKYLKKHKLPAGRWDLMPWPIIARYADQDARLTARLRIWEEAERDRVKSAQGQNGPEKGWSAGYRPEAFERRMETTRMLTRVERRGVPFSTELAREAIIELDQRIEAVTEVLAEALGGQVTLPMAKHYWFGRGDKMSSEKRDVRGLGLDPYAVTDKGEPVVDIATMAKMRRDGVPLVEEWGRYKKLTDAKTRWYEGWGNRIGPDGRLRPGFRQDGTASGRFSMEEIQLQAIPADYKVKGGPLQGIATPRDLIEAGVPEGYELWEMDLAQAELRVAAKFAQCKTMLDMIEAGVDLHGYTAEELLGSKPGSPEWGSDRQVAKRGNFSLIFGVGGQTFKDTLWKEAEVDWALERCKEFIYAWNGLYPEFRKAIDLHDSAVMQRYWKHGIGWIEDKATGERRHFTEWDVEYYDPYKDRLVEGAHKAFNQRVQPALAQYGIDRWLAEERYLRQRYAGTKHEQVGAGLVLMVHDSSVLLLPKGDGELVTGDLKVLGEELWAQRFPGLPGGLDVSAWGAHA